MNWLGLNNLNLIEISFCGPGTISVTQITMWLDWPWSCIFRLSGYIFWFLKTHRPTLFFKHPRTNYLRYLTSNNSATEINLWCTEALPFFALQLFLYSSLDDGYNVLLTCRLMKIIFRGVSVLLHFRTPLTFCFYLPIYRFNLNHSSENNINKLSAYFTSYSLRPIVYITFNFTSVLWHTISLW